MTSSVHDLDDGGALHVPARTALGRIEAEVAATAAVLRDLQAALSPLAARLSDGLMTRMQGLDLAEQTLRDLAAALAAVGAGPAGDAPIAADTAARPCKLADVARRLRGASAVSAPDDIDFF